MRVERALDVANMIDVEDFGLAATYTPVGGTLVSTTILLDEGVEEQGAGEIQAIVGTHTITFLYSIVPAPSRDAVIVVTMDDNSTQTFRLDHVQENDGRLVVVVASKVI